MTDRELLELAAKAAGLEIIGDAKFDAVTIWVVCPDSGNDMEWNPLADDGDALRLAVKLTIIITFADGGGGPYVCAGQRLGPFSRERLPVKVFALEEELAATRRVIVRAAAEIGRAMP